MIRIILGDRAEVKRRKLKALGDQLGLDVSALGEVREKGRASSKMKSSENDSVLMTDPSGKTRRVPKKDAIEAQKAGYKLKQ